LEPFSFTAEKQHDIQVVVEERVKTLVEEHVGVYVQFLSGLFPTMLIMQYDNILKDTALDGPATAIKSSLQDVGPFYFLLHCC
jgi:hypothetical protein